MTDVIKILKSTFMSRMVTILSESLTTLIILASHRMSDRIKSFKNKSWVDADDARRRRKEGAVELRKV